MTFFSKDGHHASGWLYSSSIHVLPYVHVWEQKGMATAEFLNFEDGKAGVYCSEIST